MNVLVVGAGSIGTLIGATLFKADLEVVFAGRTKSPRTEQIKQSGLTINYPSGEKYTITPDNPNVRFIDTAEKLNETFEVVIVAIKSNNLASVASFVRTHSDSNSLILHAQNGIPYWWFVDDDYVASLDTALQEQISNRRFLNSVDERGKILYFLRDRCLVGCVVKAPCGKTEQGEIVSRKTPRMSVGFVGNRETVFHHVAIYQLCELLSHYGLTTTYTREVRIEVCYKLAINIATNVLSALTGCATAKLTTNFYASSIIKTIITEIRRLFLSYGIKKADLPSEAQVYTYITEPGSQQHLPSLAQDFALHRSGEVNLITAPVEMAEIAGIKTPTLFSLAELLQVGQTHALNRESDNFNILTFDRDSGYYLLSDSVCQSQIMDKNKIPKLINHLVQINLAVVEQNVA